MAASTSNGPGGICKAAGNSGRFHWPNEFGNDWIAYSDNFHWPKFLSEFRTRVERYGNVRSSALNRARASRREHRKSKLSEELQ
jgi:hypothetical protein